MVKSFRSGFVQILVVVLLLAVLVGGGWYFYTNRTQDTELKTPSLASQIQESLVADPFAEMTIPHLRQREYESELGELTQISENSNYTTYLTSYDSDGLNIEGLLTIPAGEVPEEGHPAIVFVHGYIAPSIYVTTEKYVDYVNYLARNGYVVFKIDLRGHGESEGVPGGAYFSGDYIIDTLNARAALANTDFVDGEAIGLWGHSMAGNVIMRALAAIPTIPAISIWAGAVHTYTDMQEFGIDDNSYRPPSSDSERRRRREELAETHGGFDATDSFWRQVPATNYLDEIEGAIQINHAVNDNVVTVDYSRNLARLLEEAGKNYEYHEYETGGHNISSPAFTEAMRNTVAFFDEHLK